MSARNTRSRRGRDSPEAHQEGEIAEEANPEEEENLHFAPGEEEEQVEEVEHEPEIPIMADNNGVIDAINHGIAQITAAIAQAANNIQQPQQVHVGQFSRSPLQAHQGTILDYTSRDIRKYYELATKPLFPDAEKFQVEPEKFQTFINLLFQRLMDLGMFRINGNCMIPLNPLNPGIGTPINMVSDYGRVTLEQVTAWVQTFIQGNNRNSQNSKLLFDLLTNSISIDGLQRVQLWRNQYELNGLVSGECLLKVIIRESYLDSNATVSTLRLNLTNLDEYVLSNGTDIVAFNAYVQSQVDGLAARGEITNDLIVNLFKGYRAMKDQAFLDYLRMIENAHEDGTAIMDPPTLMLKTANFYKNKLTRKEWEQMSPHEKEVLALAAKVERLQNESKKATRKARRPTPTGTNDDGKGGDKKREKTKPRKPEWLYKNKPPKPDAVLKYRIWNNTKWYWCGEESKGHCGGKWRTHLPTNCTNNQKKQPKSKTQTSNANKRKADTLRINAAHQAIAQASEFAHQDTPFQDQDIGFESE